MTLTSCPPLLYAEIRGNGDSDANFPGVLGRKENERLRQENTRLVKENEGLRQENEQLKNAQNL